MRRGWFLRSLVAGIAAAALVVSTPLPASADVLLPQQFASWPPNFCARSSGIGYKAGPNSYFVDAATESLKNLGVLGCISPSGAPAGVIAAMPRLQVWYGAWVLCASGSHATNVAGNYAVLSSATVTGCGAASSHRLHAGSRITYDGNNFPDDRYTGVL